MTLVRDDLAFDRSAIMALAHLEYRAARAGGLVHPRGFGHYVAYAWRIAKALRARLAADAGDRRLFQMREHRTAFLQARERRSSLHPGAIALAGRGSIEVAR